MTSYPLLRFAEKKREGERLMALGEFDMEAFAKAIKVAPAEALLRDYVMLLRSAASPVFPGIGQLARVDMLEAEIIARMERGGTTSEHEVGS